MQNQAKTYLSRYQHLMAQCRSLQLSIISIRENAENITVRLDPNKVQSSAKIHDPIAESAAAIADMERMQSGYFQEAKVVLEEIMRTIKRVQDERLQNLLILRYVDGLTWEAVAMQMNYEVRQVHRLHGDALEQVNRIMMS